MLKKLNNVLIVETRTDVQEKDLEPKRNVKIQILKFVIFVEKRKIYNNSKIPDLKTKLLKTVISAEND